MTQAVFHISMGVPQAREGLPAISEMEPTSNRAQAAHMQKQTQDQHLISLPSSSLVKATNQRPSSLPKRYLALLLVNSHP